MTEPDGLALEFGEGFADDEVVVLLDGQQVWHREGVTTNYSVGLADVARLPLPASRSATLEVRVRGSAQSHRVEAAAGGGEVRLRADLTPAGGLNLGPAPEGWIF
ncbi:MAG: hypothetical protein ACRDTE_17290 [Pseudonocardiaceae bacterium]